MRISKICYFLITRYIYIYSIQANLKHSFLIEKVLSRDIQWYASFRQKAIFETHLAYYFHKISKDLIIFD